MVRGAASFAAAPQPLAQTKSLCQACRDAAGRDVDDQPWARLPLQNVTPKDVGQRSRRCDQSLNDSRMSSGRLTILASPPGPRERRSGAGDARPVYSATVNTLRCRISLLIWTHIAMPERLLERSALIIWT